MPVGKFDEYKQRQRQGGSTLRDPGRARRESKPCLSPWFCPLSRRREPVPGTPGGSGRCVLPCSGSSWDMTAERASRRSHISIESRRVQPRTIARRWIRRFDERSPISSHRLINAHNLALPALSRKASSDDHVRCCRIHPRRRRAPGAGGAIARRPGRVFGDIDADAAPGAADAPWHSHDGMRTRSCFETFIAGLDAPDAPVRSTGVAVYLSRQREFVPEGIGAQSQAQRRAAREGGAAEGHDPSRPARAGDGARDD